MRPVVTIHNELMGTSYSCEAIGVIELLGNVLAERVASTARADAPAASVIRVGPEKVTDWAFMWHFLLSFELSNLIQCID